MLWLRSALCILLACCTVTSRGENVMLLHKSARSCVRLIDFGFTEDAGAGQMRQEVNKLKQLLDKHVCIAAVY